jgi:hypothetical protein
MTGPSDIRGIAKSALKNCQKQFVIDGEAVILGVDGGISDFEALHSGRHDEEVQLYTFDMLAGDGMTCGGYPCPCARPTWRASWPDAAMVSSSPRSRPARLVPIYFGQPVK